MHSAEATKKITLQFPNHKILWSFARVHVSKNLGINTVHMTLTCNCSDAEVALAIKDFGAVVVEPVEPNNYQND